MPAVVQCLDHAPYHKLIAFSAAGRKQDVEIMLAVLPALELKEHTLREWSKALGADKALLMPNFSMRIDDTFILLKT